MSKQIKIGFDKVPAPITKQFTQLVDIEGTKLFDAAGNPLVTEEETALQNFTTGDNSLSVHVNNKPRDGGSLPVEEQFPETSQVSSSLLGVPRAEEQLSLFSDVATYGLDEDQWNEYTYTEGVHPYQWYRKENPVYGRRSNPSFNEGSKEQALYLKAFPSQYTFPRGTIQDQLTEPTKGFIRYMNFIALGRLLYDRYANIDKKFADAYFLDPDSANVVDSGENILPYNFDTSSGDSGVFTGNGSFFDVIYGAPTLQDSFDAIERWTFFFDQIKAGEAVFPYQESAAVQFVSTKEYRQIIQFATNDCTPGAGSRTRRLAILESKRAFRYQPGRASGFTFGARMGAEPSTTDNFLEWGCSNDTDEYMFQLRGSQFNIVRRSTIKMPDELLTRQGLSEDDQSSAPVYPVGVGNATPLWETVIPRSKWNGDSLLGTGPSGYILSFEDVTMYKIEYSWYGAIGAKFYAYIPSGNGEARWVLLHTFVIENGLGQPVLANADFKFKYLAYIDDSRNLQSPIYLYKYGSSYYVDGGDEGTIRLSTTTTPTKSFQNRTPILGIQPKNFIKSSTGDDVRNYKKSYPMSVSVDTTTPCRIDIEEVIGSPNGVHFVYAPSIKQNGRHPKSRNLRMKFLNDSSLQIVNGSTYNASGIGDIFPTSIPGSISVSNASDTATAGKSELSFFTTIYGGGLSIVLNGSEYEIVKVDQSDPNEDTMIIDPPYSGPELTDVPINISYRLNASDDGGHIIADGVYGAYVNPSYISTGKATNILRRDSEETFYTLISGTMRKLLRTDESVIDPSSLYEFNAKLVNYNAIFASETPIYSNKFKIHFLNPGARDKIQTIDFGESDLSDDNYNGIPTGKHFAEFLVTVSPDKPIAPGSSDDDDQVMFEQEAGQYRYFNKNDYPSVEYCHQGTQFNQLKKAEAYEWDPSYGDQMSVDPRLDRPDTRVQGDDSGYQSAVQGEITVSAFLISEVVTEDTGEYTGYKKIYFAEGVRGPSNTTIKFDSQGNPLSEVGTKFIGTGKFFETEIFRPQGQRAYFYTLADNGTTNRTVDADIDASADEDGNKYIQTKNLTLTDDWQARSFDGNGDEKHLDNQFSVSQAIRFNDQPLYPVFALGDMASVNSIVVEEISEDGTVKTHCPSFITESNDYNSYATITNSGGSSSLFSPNAFNSDERLSSCQYDISSSNPVRPGNVLFSFYATPGNPESIDLSNIFNVDRKGVSRGLLNNKAIFFTATSNQPNVNPGQFTGNIELTVTVKEQ